MFQQGEGFKIPMSNRGPRQRRCVDVIRRGRHAPCSWFMARNLAYFLVFAACRHAASLCRLPVYGLLCIVVISGRADGSTIQGKKIIKLFGWDKPTTASLRADIRRMEATGLDGTGVNLMPDPPLTAEEYGGHGNYMWFSTRHFRDEEYAKAVEDLRQTNFQRFTELFSLMAMRGPDLLSDWFDDESWQTVVHNARVHARACRKGGLRGIMVDVETSALLRYSHTTVSRTRSRCTAAACGNAGASGWRPWYSSIPASP